MNAAAEDRLPAAGTVRSSTASGKSIVLLGTSAATMGGIAAVLNSYRSAGLFERWPIVHIATHCDGSALRKLQVALRAQLQFWSLLLSGRIALVHVHGASNASFWRKSSFMLVTLLAGIPLLYHLHGGGFMDFYRKPRGAFRRWLIRYIFDRAATIIVLSEEWRRRVQTLTSNRNIIVVANPLDPELLSRPPAASSHPTILFTGRLVEEKGIFELVRAFAKVHARHPEWRLQLAGVGETELLKKQVHELGIEDHVDFLGWITGAAKLQCLREAGIYVLPSWVEGLPMSLLEGMAVGLPVIATRVGAIPEILRNDVNGKLIDPKDVSQLTDALLGLMSDASARVRLGISARESVAAEFAPSEILPRIEGVYARLSGIPAPHP